MSKSRIRESILWMTKKTESGLTSLDWKQVKSSGWTGGRNVRRGWIFVFAPG
jgi:hypothetical protein